MVEPITTTAIAIGASAVFGTKLIEEVVGKLTTSVGQSSKTWWDKKSANNRVANLYDKIASLRNVKTIWQVDKEVDLHEFYYPARVQIDDKKTKEVHGLADLPESGNIVLEGTVGLGKSILLRYLGSRELQTGKIIPLFVELRYRTSDRNLEELLLERLERWGFPKKTEILNSLLATRKVAVLCDAFDEIDDDLHGEVVHELEHLAERFPDTRIIVTSRPGAPIQKSSRFRTVKLAFLEKKDLAAIINKLDSGSEQAANLIKELSSLPAQIEEVVKTPLMVTLLVLAYKATNHVPQTVYEFYDSLFQTVLSRHDGTKPGFRRTRKTKLNDQDFRRVFEAFCFFSRLSKISAFTESSAYDVAEKAVKHVAVAADANQFIEDVKRITCLLLEEGGKLYFIHKSVQEFFCACFLRRLGDHKAQDFYEECANGAFPIWVVELSFLGHLDRCRFVKYFDLPLHQKVIDTVWAKTPKRFAPPSDAGLQRLIDQCIFVRIPKVESPKTKNNNHRSQNAERASYHLTAPPALMWVDRGGREFEPFHALASYIVNYLLSELTDCNEVSWGIGPHPQMSDNGPKKIKIKIRQNPTVAKTPRKQNWRKSVTEALERVFKTWQMLNAELEHHERSEEGLRFRP